MLLKRKHIRTWHKNGDQHAELLDWEAALFKLPDGEHKLYTAPPARQRLTDAEIDHMKVLDGHKMDTPTFLRAFARAVIAAYEAKNGITAKGEQP